MNLGVFLILAAIFTVAVGAVIVALVLLLIIGELIWRAVHPNLKGDDDYVNG